MAAKEMPSMRAILSSNKKSNCREKKMKKTKKKKELLPLLFRCGVPTAALELSRC